MITRKPRLLRRSSNLLTPSQPSAGPGLEIKILALKDGSNSTRGLEEIAVLNKGGPHGCFKRVFDI